MRLCSLSTQPSSVVGRAVRVRQSEAPPLRLPMTAGGSVGRPRIAIAHDYLTQRGGAERVVLSIARAFPDAVIHTSLYDPEATYPEFRDLDVRTSPANRWAWFRLHHRRILPFMPFIARSVRIDADVVIASSSGWSHGFRSTGHRVVYCHSPARWLYERDSYLGPAAPRHIWLLLTLLAPWLRIWDKRAARKATRYLANSRMIQARIRQAYGIESALLPAPQTVDTDGPVAEVPEIADWSDAAGYFLCVSRLLPYKNVEAVIAAFASSPDRRLVVVGQGPARAELVASAPDNVRVVSDLSDAQMRTAYAGCRALVAAAYEDFGLVPLEAASHGKPSVVLRWGGYLDTMIEDVTAVMFDDPTPDQIHRAVEECDRRSWDAHAIRDRAEDFSEAQFTEVLRDVVSDVGAINGRQRLAT